MSINWLTILHVLTIFSKRLLIAKLISRTSSIAVQRSRTPSIPIDRAGSGVATAAEGTRAGTVRIPARRAPGTTFGDPRVFGRIRMASYRTIAKLYRVTRSMVSLFIYSRRRRMFILASASTTSCYNLKGEINLSG